MRFFSQLPEIRLFGESESLQKAAVSGLVKGILGHLTLFHAVTVSCLNSRPHFAQGNIRIFSSIARSIPFAEVA